MEGGEISQPCHLRHSLVLGSSKELRQQLAILGREVVLGGEVRELELVCIDPFDGDKFLV